MGIPRLGPGPAAIVVALPREAAPLARNLGLLKQGRHGGVTRYRGWGDRLLLLQGGMGASGAARAMAFLEEPALLLSAGFCRGMGPEVGLGDLVVGSRVMKNTGAFPADPILLDAATRALKTIGLPFHAGTILTVDQVVLPGHGAHGWADRGILAVDMESAYLAEAARRQGVPFLGIRVVSDSPAKPWAAKGRLFLGPDGRLKPGAAGAYLLRHPIWTARMLRLVPTLRMATRRLAEGIQAFLKELI
ncbi:MAG: hypothetical protein ACE5I9_04245 [Candidatus Methylomirabilales bacterium]